uniref:Uncharacterized protein n=1 Tax=Oryza rufipogon TaxID=4529 RepID=A0A0E0QN07_ORYRU
MGAPAVEAWRGAAKRWEEWRRRLDSERERCGGGKRRERPREGAAATWIEGLRRGDAEGATKRGGRRGLLFAAPRIFFWVVF